MRRFFDVEYAVAGDLTRGKTTATESFAARVGSYRSRTSTLSLHRAETSVSRSRLVSRGQESCGVGQCFPTRSP